MSAAQSWKAFFSDWPAELPRRGVVLSSLNETMPFTEFWLKGDVVMLQRKNPDTHGSRFIMMNYEGIDSVRFVDPLSEQVITSAGFAAKMDRRAPQANGRVPVAQ